MSEWINVNKELPENGVLVFTYLVSNKKVGHCQCLKNYVTEYGNHDEITHWLPIPELPTIENDGENYIK